MSSRVQDQPPPIPQPRQLAVWDLVIADAERQYGHALVELDVRVQTGQDAAPTGAFARRVIDDMRERDAIGRARYATPLTAHNGRDHLVDAYQELLDFVVYLRAWLEENPEGGPHRSVRNNILTTYDTTLTDLWWLRREIDRFHEQCAEISKMADGAAG